MTDAERQLLLDFLLGHADAASFCEDILFIAHFWDDLIDKDKPIDDDKINAAMWRALVDLPRNAFYRQHFDTLNPVLMIAASDWMTATAFERDDGACQDRQATAFVIRSSYLNVIVAAAMIVGGTPYGLKMAGPLREFFHREGLVEYRKRLRDERAAREAGNV